MTICTCKSFLQFIAFYRIAKTMTEPKNAKRARIEDARLTEKNAKQQIQDALQLLEVTNEALAPLARIIQTIACNTIDQYMSPFSAKADAVKEPKTTIEEALVGLANGIDFHAETSDSEDEDTPA
jgi:hypothetical protein